MSLNSKNTIEFFAVTLQLHRYLGYILHPYIIKLVSKEGGIYTIVELLHPGNISKWEELLPAKNTELFKLLNDLNENSIVKQFSKTRVSNASFFKAMVNNEQLNLYIRGYIERRMNKCFELFLELKIPVFLKEKNFNNIYSDHQLTLNDDFALPVFNFSVGETESKYWISATYKNADIRFINKNTEVICNDPCLVRIEKNLYRFKGIDGRKLSPFFTKPNISIPKSAERKYFETFVLNIVRNQLVNPEGFTISKSIPEKKALLSLENRLAGGFAVILKFVYNSKSYLANAKLEPEVQLAVENGKYHFSKFDRDASWEKSCIDALISFGLGKVGESEFYPAELNQNGPSFAPYQLVEWLNLNTEKLNRLGFEIVQNSGLNNYYLKTYEVRFNVNTPADWFDLYGQVVLDGFQIPFIHLKKNILKNIREFILPNGQIFILPEEWFARYKPIFFLGKDTGDRISIHKSLFNLLEEINIENNQAKDLRNQFSNLITEISPLPKGLNATLRSYQKQGYIWLSLLYKNSLGGCLADDMGLGKTIQTLALLQSIKENNTSDGTKTSLIIVPTSLVHNWVNEISRFTSNMTYLIYTGSSRQNNLHDFSDLDIIITTYGIIRNDIHLITDYLFNYIILDESQAVKNPLSKTYRSVLLLKANHFLTISGTPIENSLTDLWSQMNFVNRGVLGSLKTFNEEFIQPITKNDEAKRKLLKSIIEPFILRRTKEQVAQDLPELSEQVVYCDMAEEQEKIYETEKSSIRNAILDQIKTQGYNRSAIAILRGLTRLRQIASHPLMIDETTLSGSGKFDEITRSIENIVAEGHKILVFSSFVKHLKLISNHLDNSGVSYELLTGSTTNRKEVVERFQNNTEIKLFLISIKAGGVGLNLTAADYIFILDPWWNPAVENQALSRAHRIGQNKKTFVYRFISLNTVEEKILKLQEKKEILAEYFIENSNPLSILGEKRILELID